ncbi:helix-turn-helix domain-containing protein [Acinetobacter haemolyticus]|uniref:AraC family transcriptional regulator n=1 Tax=Acinetobacter haemolyticus TaxID=29430 RepID=UPI000E57F424|nr:AraC family transcriptional regulator [Acinetobacter haemolyticus]NAR51840.1 helix-turn-helix domain-containing protein [Acinetobacter haemolyticus]NAR58501.1 helix-turn-helix domain-containing protein [Acinetobacter haemolyticus]NAR80979.1 helix-turn-helix domain-containing protein [Acinetobacter haemolyticus]NAR97085.1 helix-turn-helix domain-containing protein [Acinetobacter haemolyticus]NAS03537.1 helix-turn-helix domain-containing protein [Acinetobacter haemolyticus]
MQQQQIPVIPSRYYLRLIDILIQTNQYNNQLLTVFRDQISASDLLSIQQIEQFIELGLSLPNTEDLAFQLGKNIKLSSHSLVGYALMTSPHLEHALRLIAQYFRLIMPSFKLSIQYLTDQQKVELLFEPILQMNKQCLAFHIEAIAVGFYYSLLELAGQQLQRYQVYLSVAEPKYKEQYVHLIKANFHFNYAWVAGLRVVIDQQQLALPLPLADAHSLKVVEQRCQEQIQKIYHQGEIVEWVSMMLRQANQIPTLKECAKVLNISTKTLQRYLQQQGVEFHRLKQEISIERAIDLLENSSFTITHIAYELGYSNPANFTRAFNKVMGCSPQSYRLNHHK